MSLTFTGKNLYNTALKGKISVKSFNRNTSRTWHQKTRRCILEPTEAVDNDRQQGQRLKQTSKVLEKPDMTMKSFVNFLHLILTFAASMLLFPTFLLSLTDMSDKLKS